MTKTIVFIERRIDSEAEVARFSNGEWSGDEAVINNIKSELEFDGVDITELDKVLRIFSGSYFWAAVIPENPKLVITQT